MSLFSVQADLAYFENEDQSFSKVRIMLAIKHQQNDQLKRKSYTSEQLPLWQGLNS